MERINKLYRAVLENTLVGDKALSIFRILFVFFHIIIVFPQFIWIGEVPQAFFNPPFLSFASFFKDIPPRIFFVSIEVLLFISLLFVLIGIHTRKFLVLCFILGIVGSTFKYSFGKIDHDIFNWLLFLILAYTNSGSYLALRPDSLLPKTTVNKATAFLAFALCFAYFTAGFLKAVNWIDFDLSTSGILHWFYSGYFLLNRDLFFANWVFSFPSILLELLDYTAALFEISGFVFLLWSRKAWQRYLLFALFFHGSVILLLNISFVGMIPVLAIFLFQPNDKYYRYLEGRQKLFLPILAVVFTFIFIAKKYFADLPFEIIKHWFGIIVIFAFLIYYLLQQNKQTP